MAMMLIESSCGMRGHSSRPDTHTNEDDNIEYDKVNINGEHDGDDSMNDDNEVILMVMMMMMMMMNDGNQTDDKEDD